MSTPVFENFKEIWLVDFEFGSKPGGLPEPVCMVAREFKSKREIFLWKDELQSSGRPPYPLGEDSLFVAYYASAEFGCHLSLGWPLPTRILDLYAEFRRITNGQILPHGNGLLGALKYFGLVSMENSEKENMRDLLATN